MPPNQSNPTYYVAAPPTRLHRLPLSVRLSMEPEQCARCNARVWVEKHGFFEAAMRADEIVIVCEDCGREGAEQFAGPVIAQIATPRNWAKHFTDTTQN